MNQTLKTKLKQLAKLTGTEFIGLVSRIDQVNVSSGWFVVEETHIFPRQYKLCECNGDGPSCIGIGDIDKMFGLLDLTIGYYKKKEAI